MTAAKHGIIAEFVTGYLQREIRLVAKVVGGDDVGLRDKTTKGLAIGRLVKLTEENGVKTLTAVSALKDATHIIAQTDDTIREDQICADPENYSTLPNLICKNSDEEKTVAVWKIVDPDDIQLKDLGAKKTTEGT